MASRLFIQHKGIASVDKKNARTRQRGHVQRRWFK